MKRYEISADYASDDSWEYNETTDGAWCRYDDWVAERAKDKEEIARLRKALEIIKTKSEPFNFPGLNLTNEQAYLCEIYLVAREALAEKDAGKERE